MPAASSAGTATATVRVGMTGRSAIVSAERKVTTMKPVSRPGGSFTYSTGSATMKQARTHRSRGPNVPIGGRSSRTRRKYASARPAPASDPISETTIWNALSAGMSVVLRAEGVLEQVRPHAAQSRRLRALGDAARDRAPSRRRGEPAGQLALGQAARGARAQGDL